MSFWSIIINLLLDIAINHVKPDLSAEDVMGYIIFCSLECNGTVLPVGLIRRKMKDAESCTAFKKLIELDGMYYTLLLCNSIELATDRRMNAYGCSGGNRHQCHNRTFFYEPGKACACPILLVFQFLMRHHLIPMIITEPLIISGIMQIHHQRRKVTNHRMIIASNIWRHWSWCCVKKVKRKKRSTKANSTPASEKMSAFLLAVQKLGGNGCGHIFFLNFIMFWFPLQRMSILRVTNLSSNFMRVPELRSINWRRRA